MAKQVSAKITKDDLKKSFWRNLFLQMGWNYEKMQGLGYCYAMLPVLKKLYPDKAQLSEAMKTHLGFFNTTPAMSHLIVGANIAIEEQVGHDRDAVIGFKTGLMGPFAGVGDTVFVAIYRAIIFSIAAYLALQGSALGILITLVCAIAIIYVRYRFTLLGYSQGQKVASGFAGTLKNITEAASILGLTVVGGMVASTVKATLSGITYSLKFDALADNVKADTTTAVVKNLQTDLLDKIMPGLLPLGIVLLAYWLLGRKGMTSTWLIWILLGLGFVMGVLNSFGNFQKFFGFYN